MGLINNGTAAFHNPRSPTHISFCFVLCDTLHHLPELGDGFFKKTILVLFFF